MPKFSAFTRFGLLRFSSKRSDGEMFYRELVAAFTDARTGRAIYDLSQGTYREAWVYANAMALAAAKATLERARNQHDPGRAFDLLEAWEDSLGIAPPPDSTLKERQAIAAARYRIVRGFRYEAIDDALRTELGADYLELVVPASWDQWPVDPWTGARSLVHKVWQVDVGTSFVDETADANSSASTDVLPFPATEAIGDYFAVGFAMPFGKLGVEYAGGAGTGGVVVWEYWNGAAWAALPGILDETAGFTVAPTNEMVVRWTVPRDWAPTKISTDNVDRYYVRARITTTYSTNPQLGRLYAYAYGPGLFDTVDVPQKVVRLLEPVAGGYTPQSVLYENWSPADSEIALSAGDRLCVQPENDGLVEVVRVESASGTGTSREFTAIFSNEHDVGASASTGSVPLWSSQTCRVLVVLKSAASADPDKARRVDFVMERYAPARTQWDVVRPDSDTAPTYVPTFAMQTQPLGETVLG